MSGRDGQRTRLIVALISASAFLLFLYLIGLPPLAGALDYTRAIPLTEAIGYAWSMGIHDTLGGHGMIRVFLFIPAAMAGLTGFLLAPRGWPRLIVAAFNLVLPVYWLGPFLPIFALIGPPILVGATLGWCDGESWSEGFVSFSAMGSWTLLWLGVVAILSLSGKRIAPGHCAECGYDLRASPEECPECGAKRA